MTTGTGGRGGDDCGEYSTLEHIERRWSWFKRLLKYLDQKFISIFTLHRRIPDIRTL